MNILYLSDQTALKIDININQIVPIGNHHFYISLTDVFSNIKLNLNGVCLVGGKLNMQGICNTRETLSKKLIC